MESSASNGGLQKLLKQLKLLVRQTEDGIKSMEGFDSGLPPKLASCISAIKQAVTQTVLSSGAANVDAQQVAKVARAEANKLWVRLNSCNLFIYCKSVASKQQQPSLEAMSNITIWSTSMHY